MKGALRFRAAFPVCHPMRTSLSVLVLLLLHGSDAVAQLPGMRKYTQFDGLTASTCFAIDQDKRGYLWMGTDNGGVSFDGKKFTGLQQAGKVPDADILGCKPVGDDRILMIPLSGKVYILDKGRVLSPEEVPALKGIERYHNFVCRRDALTGTYWLFNSAMSRVIHSFNGQNIRAYRLEKPFQVIHIYGNRLLATDMESNLYCFDPIRNTYNAIYWENGQQVCNGEGGGFLAQEGFNGGMIYQNLRKPGLDFYEYIPGDSVLHYVRSLPVPSIRWNEIVYALVDRNRQVWIKFNGEGGIMYVGSLLSGNDSKSLQFMQYGTVNTLFIDRNSNIWMSSQNNALYFLSRQHFVNLLLSARLPRQKETPLCVAGDGQGNMLLGYSNARRFSFVHAKGDSSIMLNDNFRGGVRKIVFLGGTRYLLCGEDIAVFDSRTNTIAYLNSIDGTAKNLCLYGSGLLVAHNRGVNYYPSFREGRYERLRIFNSRTTCVAALPGNDILVGTPEGLYYKQDLEAAPRKVKDPMLGESGITDLLALPDGSVLAGTYTRGLYRYRPGGNTTVIRNSEGKPQHVHALYRQNDSTYWAASDVGAWQMVFNGEGVLTGMTNYTFYEGLPSNSVNSVYVCRDTAYVATTEGMGVILLDDKDSLQRQMPPPDIYVNSIQADSLGFRYPDRPVSLEHDQNNLLVSLSAVSYESLGNVRIYYRLYPYQTEWVYTADPDIRFTRLPPGNYVLEAYALNAKGVKSRQSIALEITIHPAFWQTWYFITGVAVLASMLVFMLLRKWVLRRERKEMMKVQQQKRLAVLELEAIKAQINPHFIYNCLNSIQYLNYRSEHLQAQHYLDLFARLIRMTMHYSQQTFISLEEEKEYLSRYLQLEQLRFKEKLNYDISVAGDIPGDTLLPAMLVQPYVENAVKHGIAGNEQGHIDIRFEKEGDNLRITVADNGSGFRAPARDDALGLRLSGTRAQSYNKLFNLSIRIDRYNRQDFDSNATGAVIQITIPPINYGDIMQSGHH